MSVCKARKLACTGTLIGMRWHAPDLEAIDSFAHAEQVDRTEAIRRLVRMGLVHAAKKRGEAPNAGTLCVLRHGVLR